MIGVLYFLYMNASLYTYILFETVPCIITSSNKLSCSHSIVCSTLLQMGSELKPRENSLAIQELPYLLAIIANDHTSNVQSVSYIQNIQYQQQV